jgi:hypothetical protein
LTRGLALAALCGACGAFVATQTALASLKLAATGAFARLLAVAPSQVQVASADLELPATLRLADVRAPGFTAATVDVDGDLLGALGGRLRTNEVRARHVDLGERGRVDELVLLHPDQHARLVAHGASGRFRGVPFTLRSLGVELRGREIERAAATGLAVLGLDELSAHLTREVDGLRFRVARPGLDVAGILRDGALVGEAQLDALPLDSIAHLDGARASGRLALSGDTGQLTARGHVSLDEVSLDIAQLASRRLGPLELELDGELSVGSDAHGGRTFAARELHVQLGRLSAHLSGSVDPTRFSVSLALDPVDCAAALSSLPGELLPILEGMQLEGRVAARLRATAELDDLAGLRWQPELDIGCRVTGDPPLADARTLTGTVRKDAGDRVLVLGRESPSFRRLDALPRRVAQVFVESEDSRFFAHHGFDGEMVRRALAQDLQARRYERGASTITQQVVKNLFLSGERTAARKLEEAVLAWRLEQVLSKRRILELYLNLVELGPGVYGVAEAARHWFGKAPEQLTVDEAAQLAALLPAPRRGMDAAWRRRYQALAARLR